MGRQASGNGLSRDINVVPLIDITLVLLIIFMVATPLSRQIYDVNIPEQAEPPLRPTPATPQPSRMVLFDAADGLPYQQVLTTMDTIRNAGGQLGLVTAG